MNVLNKIKLAVFEAQENEIIDDNTAGQMINFCENADIDDPEDRALAADIVDTLTALTESVDDEPANTGMSKEEIKLNIFESHRAGEITDEEMEDLMVRLEAAFE